MSFEEIVCITNPYDEHKERNRFGGESLINCSWHLQNTKKPFHSFGIHIISFIGDIYVHIEPAMTKHSILVWYSPSDPIDLTFLFLSARLDLKDKAADTKPSHT